MTCRSGRKFPLHSVHGGIGGRFSQPVFLYVSHNGCMIARGGRAGPSRAILHWDVRPGIVAVSPFTWGKSGDRSGRRLYGPLCRCCAHLRVTLEPRGLKPRGPSGPQCAGRRCAGRVASIADGARADRTGGAPDVRPGRRAGSTDMAPRGKASSQRRSSGIGRAEPSSGFAAVANSPETPRGAGGPRLSGRPDDRSWTRARSHRNRAPGSGSPVQEDISPTKRSPLGRARP